jgi:hypothetical protein
MDSDFVRAYAGDGSDVVYETTEGRKVVFTGGDRNWRNQNPGNIRSNSIRWLGKIGVAGGFCVFATPELGLRAMRKILSNRAREGKTLAEAIASYAPACENNVAAYVAHVAARAGVVASVRLRELSEVKLERVVMAMCKHEGVRVGRVIF